MLAFQSPSFSPAGGGKGPVPYFPVVVCMWQGWEKTVLRSHAFLRVWGPLGWWFMNSPQLPGKVLRSLPHLFPRVPNRISQNEHPLCSLFCPLPASRLVTLSLGLSVGILKSLFGNPEKWILPFFSLILVTVQILLKIIWIAVFD